MNANSRRKLAMATSLRNYAQSRVAGASQGYIDALTRLTERLARAESVAQQSISGQRAVSGAVATRRQLQEEIKDSLALIAGLARSARPEQPDLATALSGPDRSTSTQSFLTRGRVAAAAVVANRDMFVRLGMPDTFPDELTAQLDAYEASMNDKHASRTSHVGATAELRAVTDEIMGIVQQLDALIRFRFRDDAEALAAFESARNVAWPSGDGDGQQPGDAPSPDSSVKPAA
jgi:hypothetical protein